MALLGFGNGPRKNSRAKRLARKRAKVRKLEKKQAQAREEKALDARLKALSK